MKSKKSKKIFLLIAIIIVFILGIIVGKFTSGNKMRNFNKSSDGTSETVEKEVSTQTIENTLTSAGEIASSSTEKLTPSTTKYFQTMCVEEGDIV